MNPQYVAFSANAQFILAARGVDQAVYDIEYQDVYHYTTEGPLDALQEHVKWMDGYRLAYVSAGKLVVYDYDSTNRRTLSNASPQYSMFFAPNYRVSYSLTQAADGIPALTQTSLTTQ
ncbi:hypothetical protein IPL68_05470 [Candidatus Saccharibacteria bacterium]|nr:MAG: hypothetical protein IPL68_05470 [Candidatus Saccharibacteria bacterium]